MNYHDALALWIARREVFPPHAITDVVIDSLDEGGTCGNDTCWFDGSVTLSFLFAGSPEARTYDIAPGSFITEVAALARGV